MLVSFEVFVCVCGAISVLFSLFSHENWFFNNSSLVIYVLRYVLCLADLKKKENNARKLQFDWTSGLRDGRGRALLFTNSGRLSCYLEFVVNEWQMALKINTKRWTEWLPILVVLYIGSRCALKVFYFVVSRERRGPTLNGTVYSQVAKYLERTFYWTQLNDKWIKLYCLNTNSNTKLKCSMYYPSICFILIINSEPSSFAKYGFSNEILSFQYTSHSTAMWFCFVSCVFRSISIDTKRPTNNRALFHTF